VKPPPFTYHRPGTLDDALALLRAHGDEAKVLAGGQSLVPLLALRLASPAHLVDLAGIPGLGSVEVLLDPAGQPARVRIGATVTQRQAEQHPAVQRHVPLLAEALPLIAHVQIRNAGTVCGSLAHADPAAELPAVALALEAELVVAGPAGERRVPAAEFFRSYLETALGPDEVLVAVELPAARPGSGAAYREVSRRHGDYAMVGVGVSLALDPAGCLVDVRIALAGVATTPVRAPGAEQAIAGTPGDAALPARIEHAAGLAAAALRPPADLHATAAYRTHLARVLIARALASAVERATEARP
jgi:carbon-monoxide dehydrogenase medium subunit